MRDDVFELRDLILSSIEDVVAEFFADPEPFMPDFAGFAENAARKSEFISGAINSGQNEPSDQIFNCDYVDGVPISMVNRALEVFYETEIDDDDFHGYNLKLFFCVAAIAAHTIVSNPAPS